MLGALRGEFPGLVRSTLHRHLQRNGLGRLPRAERETKAFKAYEPGFLHVDALYLARRASYNRHRPRGGLGHRTPLEEAKRWYKERPELFRRDPASFALSVPNLARPDT